jgi:tetratricopeptide (TPR) repeat protein
MRVLCPHSGHLIPSEGWRTLQQRVEPVSSVQFRLWCCVLCLAISLVAIGESQNSLPATPAKPQNTVPTAASDGAANVNPAQLFQRGQDALNRGQLDEAERDFRNVLVMDPQAAGAYANLGVVYMRRKQWPKALDMLHKAEHLLPQLAGIRLNIGLAYYRQNEFLKAIPAFESVLRDQPDSQQARHLLGL